MNGGRSGMRRTVMVVITGAATAALFVLAQLVTVTATADTLAATWSRQSPRTLPSGRNHAAMAFHAPTGQTVLFGGRSSGGWYLSDTWTWNGVDWSPQSPLDGPSARDSASMAFDAARGQLVLFGGWNGSHLGDTWTWTGVTWLRQSPPTSPSNRYGAGMAYDPKLGQVVLFGGWNGSTYLDDTWAWNGVTWIELPVPTRPPGREFPVLQADPLGRLVMFGGSRHLSGGYLGDTWILDGATWTSQSPANTPGARGWAGSGTDAGGRVVMFGGHDSWTTYSDTWVWDGTGWWQRAPVTRPSARSNASMARDPLGRVLLFGGDGTNETWTFTDTGSPEVPNDVESTPPGQPLLPTAVPGPDARQITLTWAPPSRNVATSLTYRVYRRTSSSGWSAVQTTSGTTYVDSGLNAGDTYHYAVSAANDYGEGPWSAETSASPYAVSEGPYTTVTPNYNGRADQTYYQLGLRVRHGNQTYGTVQSGVLDGPLPATTPPYAYNITNGTDADGDGVPSTLVVHYRTTTVSDSGGQTHTAAGTTPLPLDPNDNDDSTPRPKIVEGPYTTVTPNYGGKTDQTYYKVGLRILFAGQTYGSVQEGVVNGPLPATTPTYPANVTFGTDADGDGVPSTVVLHNRTTTVSDTGGTSHTSTGTSAQPVDPHDGDDTTPRPKVVDGPYAQATPGYAGETYATHYKVGTMVRYAGEDYGLVLEGTVTPFRDVDRDFVPDESEATLCANQNPNFNADGTCVGPDYSPPTVQGILDDLEWLP